jgi:hypothetical protein
MKIGKRTSEMSATLTVAYGENAMKNSNDFEWHRRLKEEQDDVQDGPRSGQPNMHRTDANVVQV